MKKTFESDRVTSGAVPDFVRYVFPAVGSRGGQEDESRFSWDEAVKQEEVEQRERKSRDEGLAEGESRAREKFDAEIAKERAVLHDALRGWEKDQASYFQQAEAAVVDLALSIARKILQREVAIDTLLLRGAVRVALDRIQSATDIRLRVRPEDASRWQELLDGDETLPCRPEVTPDKTLEPGQCVLETSLGSTDLGWESQMKDLEQSFQDLMAMRPVNE